MFLRTILEVTHTKWNSTTINTQQQNYCYTGYSQLPNAMFKSVMRCSWINIVDSAKLLKISKSLELRSIDDGHQERVEFNVSVNRIVETLSYQTKNCKLLNKLCAIDNKQYIPYSKHTVHKIPLSLP